ncbi:MAG: hypothetical protein NZ480_04320 [Bdellovibrionaceae bacterium]|nr:hypothetical protein [Pseudobdellovibrionaceae bacterium]MDW8189972.1 hypothetical protein [Pseudobdellovibrionaceae bacterium]
MSFSTIIMDFVTHKSSLEVYVNDGEILEIVQPVDQKRMILSLSEVEEVIRRTDHEGDEFLQLNLSQDRKILVTRNLIGFKPLPVSGLDLGRLPRVVTTVDLISVADAIEEVMSSDQSSALIEVDILKKVYLSIIQGAERVGFNLKQERQWLMFHLSFHFRASA